jgi:hypothetical protein
LYLFKTSAKYQKLKQGNKGKLFKTSQTVSVQYQQLLSKMPKKKQNIRTGKISTGKLFKASQVVSVQYQQLLSKIPEKSKISEQGKLVPAN